MTQLYVILRTYYRNRSPKDQEAYQRIVAEHTRLVPCAKDIFGHMVQFGDELRYSPKHDTVLLVPTSLYDLTLGGDPEYVCLTSRKHLDSHLISHAELRFRAG